MIVKSNDIYEMFKKIWVLRIKNLIGLICSFQSVISFIEQN